MEEDFPTDIGLDELLAMLSHELRTPLTTILGWSRVLRSRTINEDTVRAALEAIERNARAQVQIIDDLLAVSEVITGKVRLNLRRLDCVTLIRDAIRVARPALDARTIRVEATLDPAAAAFVGDPDRAAAGGGQRAGHRRHGRARRRVHRGSSPAGARAPADRGAGRGRKLRTRRARSGHRAPHRGEARRQRPGRDRRRQRRVRGDAAGKTGQRGGLTRAPGVSGIRPLTLEASRRGRTPALPAPLSRAQR